MVITSMLFALLVLLIIGGIIAALIFGAVFALLIMLTIGVITLIVDRRREKKYLASAEFSETAIPYKRKKHPRILIAVSLTLLTLFTVIYTVDSILSKKRAMEVQAQLESSLEWCVEHGEFEAAQKLIENGITPDIPAYASTESNEPAAEGEHTLLMEYCGSEFTYPDADYEQVEFLVRSGADVNRRAWTHKAEHISHSGDSTYGYRYSDACGITPLMLAASAGNTETVRLLIEYGADVNAANYCGKTPLMYAATSQKGDRTVEIIEILLENGAEKYAVDNYGQTAHDHALHFDADKIYEYLR
ncbi:MAG: ankyrin repeat domain-containing protein [Oscillospiraceae bacterium]|nr:ankyrin repeat domain-containing protein [Oscillospiraceae bacterium]